jgi:hypothetical protein
MIKAYGNIKCEADLKMIQSRLEVNQQAVGVSDGGNLFTLNKNSSIFQITREKAQELLQATHEEMDLIISSRGKYVFPDPVVEEPSIDALNIPFESTEVVPDVIEPVVEKEVVQSDTPIEKVIDVIEGEPEVNPDDEPDDAEDFVQISKEEYDELLDKSTSYDAIKDLILTAKY